MKLSMLFTLPLAAALALPGVAQQTTTDNQQPAATQSNPQASQSSSQAAQTTTTTTTQDTTTDQNLSARQPLQPEQHEGFWGKMNPFARKKYVQRQLTPIRDRVNELDDLTAENARQIKDVDARAQEGIRNADAKATLADQHAVDAGNRAQQAYQTASAANTRLGTVEQVVGNIDQYQPATQTEIRFRSGQTTLSKKDRDALDDMTANLQNQKGYIIQVQGFSNGGGQAGIQSSQAMANSVVRYLVEKNQIPVYRVYMLGMGNAKMPSEDGTTRARGNRVEISLLKNNVDQLASAQSSGTMNSGMANQSSSYSTSQSSGSSSAPAQNQQSAPMQSQPSNPPQQ
ncbi:MAG TPA: OmpA family protein [Terriglobales bacterium]|jgi:outer membrane protein OmpA-like peptidoglycan-associated protein|nr:OmpA family protein [Terriglobales bacterium]